MDSKSERVRLAAVLRASDILLEHQRGEERAAIAIERAQARKAEAEAATQAPAETPEADDRTAEIDRILYQYQTTKGPLGHEQ